MSAQGRVDRARERLESAQTDEVRDQAIRIIKLNPPIEGGLPVLLHRRLTVLRRLSNSGKRTLFSTIDGMQRDAAGIDDANYSPGNDLPQVVATELGNVIDSCQQALLLSGAEIRGADMALADLDEQIRSSETSLALVPDAVAPEFARFVDQAVESPADADSIRAGLLALRADQRRSELVAACATGSNHSIGHAGENTADEKQADENNADEVVDVGATVSHLFRANNRGQNGLAHVEAQGDLSEYDMAPGSPAYVLTSRLEQVGISTSPLEVEDVTTRLLTAIDDATMRKAQYEASIPTLTGPAAALVERRQSILHGKAGIKRKIATQKQLLRLAQAQLRGGGGHKPHGLMPVLLEEPFAELPDHLTSATLSMLLRHSEAAQVLVVTERSDVKAWCSSIGTGAGCVDATGWFAQEHSEW